MLEAGTLSTTLATSATALLMDPTSSTLAEELPAMTERGAPVRPLLPRLICYRLRLRHHIDKGRILLLV
jgi:hypothetical protein